MNRVGYLKNVRIEVGFPSSLCFGEKGSRHPGYGEGSLIGVNLEPMKGG